MSAEKRRLIQHHLQSLVVDGVHRVPLDAGLPFALARFVGEQITFDVTETNRKASGGDGGVGALRAGPFSLNAMRTCHQPGSCETPAMAPGGVITETL